MRISEPGRNNLKTAALIGTPCAKTQQMLGLNQRNQAPCDATSHPGFFLKGRGSRVKASFTVEIIWTRTYSPPERQTERSNQAAPSTRATSAMMSWCSNWETRCWQGPETKLTNRGVQVDWINYIEHMSIHRRRHFDTSQDVAHGMSGILGFRAGLWLSCFPGRVGDDMELWGMYRAARQQPEHSQGELRVCVWVHMSLCVLQRITFKTSCLLRIVKA